MPEVYTPENIEYHSLHTGNPGKYNGRTRLTEEDVKDIRIRKRNGEPLQSIYLDYQDKVAYGSFCNTANGYN